MFENLLHQDMVSRRLHEEWLSRRLAPSLLFYGPSYAGKLTAALELARVISCSDPQAPWNCGCSHCRRHRLLEYPHLMMLGSRSFQEEIAAAGDAYLRNPQSGARFLYVRSLRKLTRRFDTPLWSSDNKNYKKALSALSEINDNIDTFLDETGDVHEEPRKLMERNRELAAKLEGLLPQGNIPIDQIRNLQRWIHSGSSGAPRIVILENADAMQEASRNALLKLLEEPPEGLYLILLTTRRSAVIPTLLSRLRPYGFIRRTDEEQQDVLNRVFREPSGEYNTLRSFFLAWQFEHPQIFREQTLRFLEGLFRRDADFSSLQIEAAGRGKDPRLFMVFLEELTLLLQDIFHRKNVSTAFPEIREVSMVGWMEMIRECRLRREVYNQGAALLLESLFYSMRREV